MMGSNLFYYCRERQKSKKNVTTKKVRGTGVDSGDAHYRDLGDRRKSATDQFDKSQRNNASSRRSKGNKFVVLTPTSYTHLEDTNFVNKNNSPGKGLLETGIAAYDAGHFELAKHYYTKAAAQGELLALHNLGIMFLHGQGTSVNYSRAYECFITCSFYGVAASMAQLGYMHLHGRGVPEDYEKAIKWLWRAHEAGSEPYAQYVLASMCLKGFGAPSDLRAGTTWLAESARNGYVAAIYNLALVYEEQENTLAVDLYKRSGLYEGHGPSQNNLGVLYATGRCKVKKNYKRAVILFHMAAKQGSPESLYNLGEAYTKGIGVRRDILRGARYYYRASKHGKDGEAEFQLGNLFLYGHGNAVKPNDSISLYWFGKAVKKGHKAARNNFLILQQYSAKSKMESLQTLEKYLFHTQHVY